MRKGLTALGVLFSVGFGYGASFAQSGSDIINIFGGLMQTAISQAIQAEWRKLPPAEISCIDDNLRQRGSSIGQLAQQNYSPNDARLADVRRFCRGMAVQNPPALAASPSVISIYAVDGLNLGAKVNFDSNIYRQYQCGPSEQFDGFTWCSRKVPESSRRGAFVSSYSILHSPDGTVSYVNRFLEPAWFSGNEANEDIARLTKKHGLPPSVMAMPSRDGIQGVMASWGEVTLLPLDAGNVAQLAQGRDVRAGLMVDFLGNFRRSAQLGLPIYRLAGGPGFVWAANWDQGGRGTLRFFAVDASTLSGPAIVQPQVQANLGAGSVAEPAAPAAAPPPAPAPPPVTYTPAPAPPPVVRAPDPNERARSRIKDALTRIANHRDGLPAESFRSRLDAIASRLAPVGESTDSATLKDLMSDCDAVSAIFDEAAEFGRVAEVAGRKVDVVNAKLQGVGDDVPMVQELKTAMGSVGDARTKGDLTALKRSLAALNEGYDEFSARESRLKGSGIVLKK